MSSLLKKISGHLIDEQGNSYSVLPFGITVEFTTLVNADNPGGWIGSAPVTTTGGNFELFTAYNIGVEETVSYRLLIGSNIVESGNVVVNDLLVNLTVSDEAYQELIQPDDTSFVSIKGRVIMGNENIAAIPISDSIIVSAQKAMLPNNIEVASTKIDELGNYELNIPCRLFGISNKDIIPEVFLEIKNTNDSILISEYYSIHDIPDELNLHVVDKNKFNLFYNEYQYVAERLSIVTGLSADKFYTITSDGKRPEIKVIVSISGLAKEVILNMILASIMKNKTGIDLFQAYALIRYEGQSIEVLSDMNIERLEIIMSNSVVNHIIPPPNDLMDTLERLNAYKVELISLEETDDETDLIALLTPILPEETDIKKIIDLNLQYKEQPISDFWAAVSANFGPAVASRAQHGFQLLAVTGLQQEMTGALLDYLDGAPVSNISTWKYGKWLAFVQDVCTANSKLCVPKSIRGESTDVNDEIAKEAYAEMLYNLSTDVFVTANLVARTGTDLGGYYTNNEEAQEFFAEHPDFDFLLDNLWEMGFTGKEDFKKELLPLQNLARLFGGRPDAVVALVNAGIYSSSHIAAIPETDFVAAYSSVFRSVDKTLQLHSKAVHTDMLLKQAYLQTMPGSYVEKVTKDWSREIWTPKVNPSPTSPDLETLFGSMDFCACSDCTSMYSPSAYFTDILNFIKTKLGSAVAYDEIIRRRPDLIHIDLSCKNSNTPLPYIDLVNEQLELLILRTIIGLVVPISFQTSGNAKDLDAYPEHTFKHPGTNEYENYDDYARVYDERLNTAIYPNSLPFSLPIEESRVYFNHLGYSRGDLMNQYKPVDYLTLTGANLLTEYNVIAESLGISSLEADIITKNNITVGTWAFYGFQITPKPPTWVDDLCGNLEDILARSNITYKELLQLLVTNFLNKKVGNPAERTFKIVAKPGMPQDTCVLEELMLEYRPITDSESVKKAAKELFFDKLHRFIRLYRATGWSIYQLDMVLDSFFTTVIDINTFKAVGKLQQFCKRFKSLPEKASILWAGTINTTQYLDFNSAEQLLLPSVYDTFFNNKSVLNPPDANFNNPINILGSMQENAGTIIAAFEITTDDVQYLFPFQFPTIVNLNNLQQIFRFSLLKKWLGLSSFSEVGNIFRIWEINPNALSSDPTEWDAAFIKIEKIKKGIFSLPELTYFFRHYDPDNNFIPAQSIIQPFFENLRLELRNQLSNPYTTENKDFLKTVTIQRFCSMFNIQNKLGTLILTELVFAGSPVTNLLEQMVTVEFIQSTEDIVPADSIPTLEFQDLYRAYYKIDKIVRIVSTLKLSDEETVVSQYLSDNLEVLKLAEIPTEITDDSATNMNGLYQLNDWVQVRDKYNLKKEEFIGLLYKSIGQDADGNPTTYTDWLIYSIDIIKLPVQDLLKLTGFPGNLGILNAVFDSINPSGNDFRKGNLLLQILEITISSTKTGLGVSNTYDTLLPTVQLRQAQAVRKTAKSKYSDDGWLKVAKPLQDQLREKQRKALVAYVLAHPDIVPGNAMKWKNENGLFAYLLIDVEMQPCMKTSRIKQGISTLQLYLDRIILNIEKVNGGALITMNTDMVAQWQSWRKWYRVWEANRKVFLYPENWIEPELRDNKTKLFKELETQLLQDEITDKNVEAAYRQYLEDLDEVARLEPVSAYHDTLEGRDIVHVFSRTDVYPQRYYYRKLENNEWTTWERINVDIKSDHVVPVMWNNRLYLFWLTFIRKAATSEEAANRKQANRGTSQPEWVQELVDNKSMLVADSNNNAYSSWDITLNWTSFLDGKWQKSDLSKDVMNIDISKVQINNSAKNSYVNTTYAKKVLDDLTKRGEIKIDEFFKNRLYLYTPFEDADTSKGITFNLLFSAGLDENGIGLHTFLWKGDNSRDPFVLRDNDRGHQILAPLGTRFNKMKFEEDPSQSGKLMKDSYGGTIDGYYSYSAGQYIPNFPRSIRGSSAIMLNQTPFGRFRITTKAAKINEHGMNPLENKFFFEDEKHTFYVDKVSKLVAATAKYSGIYSSSKTSISGSIGFAVAQYNIGYNSVPDVQAGTLYQSALVSVYNENNYLFTTFYHAQSPKFISTLNNSGISALLTLPNQSQDNDTIKFALNYLPTSMVNTKYPKSNVQFAFSDPYSIYNWELFFHAPMLIAQGLSNNQKFEEAQKWYHYIFNPTSNVNISNQTIATNQRFWKFYPFYVESATSAQTLSQLLADINNNVAAAVAQVRKWEKHPFNPHIIARMRILAYMKNVLMKYLDNLIAWGDQLFRRDTIESINEATQLYILAANILGEKPKEIPPRVKKEYRTFDQLGPLDALSNAMVAIESFYDPNGASSIDDFSGKDRPDSLNITTLYFCLPKNDKLMGYWDTIADRLFKIRNCMNIDGVVRQLPLYEPPIDPALLVRATAMGVDINTILDQINNVDAPLYRFSYVVQKANELVNDVKSLGNSLLSAIEKKDAEALSMLRSGHEIQLLERIKFIKELQLSDAESALEAIRLTKENTQLRFTYYSTRQFKNANEEQHLNKMNSAMNLQFAQGILETTAGILSAIPTIHAQLIASGASFGGLQLSNVMRAASTAIGVKVGLDNIKGSMALTTGGYERRRDDWVFQANTAAKELQQLDQQILGAEIRVDIAQRELSNHELQMENTMEVDSYMRNKFSNTELYNWMTAQISATYFQSYNLAYDMAKRAEWCYQYELPLTKMPATGFIKFGYWDSLRKGLMTGERLQFDLRKMDATYMEENKREFELTKNISLALNDTQALLALRSTGSCTFEIPEVLFDMDYPGHYLRRLKSVSISIPCIAGPYTTINCELRLIKSKYRKSIDILPPDIYEESPLDSDPRFVYNNNPVAIATSSGQNDSGVFELNFRDERYVPFEGMGAISEWQITFPDEYRQFDYESITDAIIHLKYTATTVNINALKGPAEQNIASILANIENNVLNRYFSLKHEFSNEWYRYLKAKENEEPGAAFELLLKSEHFPYFCQGKNIEVIGWFLQLNPKNEDLEITVDSPLAGIDDEELVGKGLKDVVLLQPQYISVTPEGVSLPMTWDFTNGFTMDDLSDFYLVAHYRIIV